MTIFQYKGKEFYIDNQLQRQIDTKVIPDLKKRDKDAVYGIDGKERSGKSKFGDILGAYFGSKLGTDYDLHCVCINPTEFRNAIMRAPKNGVVIYDEAHKGMGSRRSLSEINNILIDLMMEMGQKNLLVLIILPTIFMLDRYVALYRIRGLFHIYERKGHRGYWVYFNEKNKLILYIKGKKLFNYNCMRWPRFRGRFLNQWSIDEDAYRLKKRKSFEEKGRITRVEKVMEQRNRLLYLIWKENKEMSSLKLRNRIKSVGVKIEQTQIHDIIRETKQIINNEQINEKNKENTKETDD